MALMEMGSRCGKFSLQASGGVNYLKSLAGPLPDFLVCPTGGIKAETATRIILAALTSYVSGVVGLHRVIYCQRALHG